MHIGRPFCVHREPNFHDFFLFISFSDLFVFCVGVSC